MISRLGLSTIPRIAIRRPPLQPRVAVRPPQFSTTSRQTASNYRRFGDPPRQQQARIEGGGGTNGGGSGFDFRSIPFLRNVRRPPNLVVVGVGGVGGAYYLTHLEKLEISPEMSRYRFLDVSPATEKQMGEQSYREVMNQYSHSILPPNHPTSRHVTQVVKRLLEANPSTSKNGVEWKVHVVEDGETKNAFVLPGGQIFVFTGILPVCASDDGLAVVLGHEIGHQLARHSAERLSSMKVLTALGLVLESAGLDIGISRLLLNLVMTLPNSRKNESEADYIGLELATAACFDPRAAKSLWQRMDGEAGEEGKKGGVNMSFLSTHPASSQRAVEVEKWASKLILDRPGGCGPLKEQFGQFGRAISR